jgi:hypothetical protein
MMPGMRPVLTATCALTIAAAAWLGVMFAILHRPGWERGVVVSALFVAQSLVAFGATSRWLAGPWWRVIASVGALALMWAGASAVISDLHSRHFEGYVLIIGVLLALQGLLTLAHLIPTLLTPSSKVHQFGN